MVKYVVKMNRRCLSHLQEKIRLLYNEIQDANAALTYSVVSSVWSIMDL